MATALISARLRALTTVMLVALQACTSAPAPAVTATPTLIPTPTPTAAPPMILIESSRNCAGGPTEAYPLVAVLEPGDIVPVVGKDDYGDYWIVMAPSIQRGCWILREGTVAQGETDYLPNLVPGPTPNPAPAIAPENFRVVQAHCNVLENLDPPLWEISVLLAWNAAESDADTYRLYRDEALVAYPDHDTRQYQDTFRTKADDRERVTYALEATKADGSISEAREASVTPSCE